MAYRLAVNSDGGLGVAALNRREDEDVVVDSVFKLLMVSWLLVEAMMIKH